MTLQEAVNHLNKQDFPELPLKKKWHSVFIEASLHIRGYQPSFKDLSKTTNGTIVTPSNWGGTDYDDFFEKFVFSRHPRENIATRQWRLSQYRPLQKAILQQEIEDLQASIFADSQYQLTLEDVDDQKYIDGNNFDGDTLTGWFAKHLPAIIEDPNGYIVTLPKHSKSEAPAGKLEVILLFVNETDIVFKDEDSLTFMHDNSAWYLDKNEVYKLTKSNNGKYEASEVYYTHLMDRLPAVVAGGLWNTEGYYNSFFDKAIPVCTEFVSVYSAGQMIDKEASHPYIIMAAEDCPECNAVGTIQEECNTCEGGYELKTCPTCHGKKTVSYNPADRYEVPREMMKDEVVRIVNPDITINDYHAKKLDSLKKEIRSALNLTYVDEAQSSLAKALDMENKYKFTGKLSNHIFDNLVGPSVELVIMYRNARASDEGLAPNLYNYQLVKPTQFAIKTSQDLQTELSDAIKSGLPGYLRFQMLGEYSDKRFGGDLIFQKKSQVILALDDLCVYSPEEKLTMGASGEASLTDIVFSRKLPGILDKIIRVKSADWFLKATIDQIEIAVTEERNKIVLPAPVAQT